MLSLSRLDCLIYRPGMMPRARFHHIHDALLQVTVTSLTEKDSRPSNYFWRNREQRQLHSEQPTNNPRVSPALGNAVYTSQQESREEASGIDAQSCGLKSSLD